MWSRRRCLRGRAALLAVPSHCRTADSPHATPQSLPMPSPHRHVCASLCTSAPLLARFEAATAMRTWPSSPSPCHLRHRGRAGHAGGKRACLSASTCAWVSKSSPTASRQGEDEPSPPVAPRLCLSLFLPPPPPPSRAINYPANDHLHSIYRIHGFTIMSSRCPTPPSLEACMAKLQFWSFPPPCR